MVYKILLIIFGIGMVIWWIEDSTSHWFMYSFIGTMSNAILVRLEEISKEISRNRE